MDSPGPSMLAERFAAQRAAFQRRAPLGHAERSEALGALGLAILGREGDLARAIAADFGGRAATETRLLEIFPVLKEIRHARRHLGRWMQERRAFAEWPFWPSRTRIIYQPRGVVGIIGPWNYPVLLTMSPLVCALAAGNHALIKPSELAPATADVLARMIADLFPPDYVSVITGGPEVASAFCALPFDHILFTGSTRVGKLVMAAAAPNLTPVTLELGGKSPALVHADFPARTAAERIATAKVWNGGQTCIAPDYVLVARSALEPFVAAMQTAVAERLGGGGMTHIINRSSTERLAALVEEARAKGARVIEVPGTGEAQGGEGRSFPVTLIVDPTPGMRVMQEEIFGPVLPVVPYASLDDAIAFINARPRPLALYYFDHDSARVRRVLGGTTSGGATINDCTFHIAQTRLPFGGVGPSGMGAYHGFDGFAALSHKKGVYLQNPLVGRVLGKLAAPPYGPATERLLRFLIGRSPPS